MNPMYSNALSGLASGMADAGGSPPPDMSGAGGQMIPCPLCGGTGMVSEAMLAGNDVPMLPPRLAARGGGAPMQMPPSASPSPFPQ